jgi:hypothetical protein
MAPHTPMFCAPDAVPRITLTKPSVSTDSIKNASSEEEPNAGEFEPYVAETWITDWRNHAASTAPTSCTTMYPGTLRHVKSRRRAKARLTAGLRWAPEPCP